MLDYIIVGQGIAGSMLAWQLLQRGCKILVIDKLSENTASRVASGIINPITGRRFVKTWMADEIIPFAQGAYQKLGEQFNGDFIKPVSVVKLFHSVKEQNDWSLRASDAEYAPFLNPQLVQLDKSKVQNDFGGFEIINCFKVDVQQTLISIRKQLQQNSQLLEESFSFDDIRERKDFVEYQEHRARAVIFCEGIGGAQTPFFKYLPFQPAKGEALVVKIENFYKDKIINGDLTISWTGEDDLYYAGATHQWNFDDEKPSRRGKEELENNLRTMLSCPYQIVEHKSAVRPTVKDRRPFVGIHPQHQRIAIFNGLGTKGVSLAPYFANHLADHLLDQKPLMPEVDISRFA